MCFISIIELIIRPADVITLGSADVITCGVVRRPKGVIDFTVGGGIFPSAGPNFDYLNWTKFYDLGQVKMRDFYKNLCIPIGCC